MLTANIGDKVRVVEECPELGNITGTIIGLYEYSWAVVLHDRKDIDGTTYQSRRHLSDLAPITK